MRRIVSVGSAAYRIIDGAQCRRLRLFELSETFPRRDATGHILRVEDLMVIV